MKWWLMKYNVFALTEIKVLCIFPLCSYDNVKTQVAARIRSCSECK